jgi:hypothetical protein
MDENYRSRLHRARKIQLTIFAATATVGCVIGLVVGILTHSVVWALIALLGAGVVFISLGCVVFLVSGGYHWLRHGPD